MGEGERGGEGAGCRVWLGGQGRQRAEGTGAACVKAPGLYVCTGSSSSTKTSV